MYKAAKGEPVTEGDLVELQELGTGLVAVCALVSSALYNPTWQSWQQPCAQSGSDAAALHCMPLTDNLPQPKDTGDGQRHCTAGYGSQCSRHLLRVQAMHLLCAAAAQWAHLVAGSPLHQSLNTQVGHLRAQNAARAPLRRQTKDVGSCTCRTWHGHHAEAALMWFMAVPAVRPAWNLTTQPTVTVKRQP